MCNPPTWVIETNVFAEECFDRMIHHLAANTIPFTTVRVIPFIHEIDGKVPDIVGPVVVYGSIGIQKLSERHNWKPGVFSDAESFNMETYRDQLGGLFLNQDARVMMLSQVLANVTDEEFFIKPRGDTKEFAGTIVTLGEFSKWHQNMVDIGYLENEDFEVVVASTKKLGCEWRVVVVDGKIVTASIYRQYGIVRPQEHIIPEVEAVVYQAHSKFVPAPVYVIDIAQIGDEYKVIEYNTFNSSGLYACDVGKIIDAVNNLISDNY